MRIKTIKNYKTIILATCVLTLAALSGCATQSNKDPLEGFNRGVYKFNDVADKAVIKPVAIAYKTITPTPIRTGFNNFFSNLGSLTTVLNDLLQLKLANAFTDAGRFVINSTFGIAGFIDVAGKDNIRNHKEDFGQTLGYWGVGNGAYLVLPLLGPSSLRDTTGLVFDTFTTDPITYPRNIGQIRLSNQLRAAQFLDKRTELLTASDLVDEASLDPYAFTRDAYLQKRASLVQDGLVPEELIKDDFEDVDTETAIDPVKADTPAQ
ncbi:VacJ family lipoprotein [Methylotenera sp.]|uniref:MlaA family lipoprotein n=1 Tax=Methylotenera sp. TaxID=2051956 RepID=UPI00248726E4|nr:VacJ family lipoprotein [Methylotenera sp.]MDI1360474.1 VacJ family lipoprotein [Methylotenera sp.]